MDLILLCYDHSRGEGHTKDHNFDVSHGSRHTKSQKLDSSYGYTYLWPYHNHTIPIPKLYNKLYQSHFGGGNVNKLLSRSADKLSRIELRSEENRGGESDISRSITRYLVKFSEHKDEAWLKEGVRRIAKSWVETRNIQKDMPQGEFHAAWDAIRKEGFSFAYTHFQNVASKARTLGYTSDANAAEETEKKLVHVFADPLERQMLADMSLSGKA